MWGKTRAEFITHTGQMISVEATPTVILITDGVGKESLGMVTNFCHHDQAYMEASDALSTLHQCDSPEQSMVVVRRYTNTPYIPQETFHFLYLDVYTVSRGTFSAYFPLDQLHLCRLLPFSQAEVVLLHEEGEVGLKVYPIPERFSGKTQKRNTASDPVLQSISLSTLLYHQEQCTQIKEESGYYPTLQQLQDFDQAVIQLKCKLGQRHKSWPKDTMIIV